MRTRSDRPLAKDILDEPVFYQIFEASKHMQDLRDDLGHAQTVTEYALFLSGALDADVYHTVPAAILHDVGYFGMQPDLLKLMMAKQIPKEEEALIRQTHMRRGAEFANEILNKLKYAPLHFGSDSSVQEIATTIRRHDLAGTPMTLEEAIVKDADKLWRFSGLGFATDLRRIGCSPYELYKKRLNNINAPGFFHTSEAKELAWWELHGVYDQQDKAA